MTRTFRLAGLVRLRRMQEEQAAAELARANARRESADRRRTETETVLADSALPDRADAEGWRVAVAGRTALAGMVQESLGVLHAAGAAADDAARQWSDARVRAATLDRLEARHARTVRLAERTAEQLALDEVATRRATTAQGER